MGTAILRLTGVLILFFCIVVPVLAQPYLEGGKTRHRFAQLNLGTDVSFLSRHGTYHYPEANDGNFLPQKMKSLIQNRLVIGGTHFWGKADFYIAIPFAGWKNEDYCAGVETGGKYFFRQIETRKISPFVGASMVYHRYQMGRGVNRERIKFPVQAGMVYTRGRLMAEMGVSYFLKNKLNYYYDTHKQLSIRTPTLGLNLGLKWMLETTGSAEKNWQSSKTKLLTDTLAQLKKLNGLTLAAGPSSAFFTAKSQRNQMLRPFLYQHQTTNLFIDIGLGYYYHRNDFQVNLSYRNNESGIKAFGIEQRLHRNSIALEVFKFIADYHGFVPFIGPFISREQLSFTEVEYGKAVAGVEKISLKPGVIFGWDIRPDRLQAILLRTNLRWTPQLLLRIDGGAMRLDQLEFNFIQVVVFPERLLGYSLK